MHVAQGGDVMTDQNGETYRANEWGNAVVALSSSPGFSDWETHAPASNFGETGAASPLLSIVLQTRAFVRGYASSDAAVVAVSDDGPERGAVVITSIRDT